MKKRFFKKREAILKGTGYDSLYEKTMHETKLQQCRFHDKSDKVEYTVSHKYEPDFVHEEGGKIYLLELKGRFRDSSEMSKYIWIREVLPENTELVFIWEKHNTVTPFAKKRKDGTKQTNEEWADKKGFRNWAAEDFDLQLL